MEFVHVLQALSQITATVPVKWTKLILQLFQNTINTTNDYD